MNANVKLAGASDRGGLTEMYLKAEVCVTGLFVHTEPATAGTEESKGKNIYMSFVRSFQMY